MKKLLLILLCLPLLFSCDSSKKRESTEKTKEEERIDYFNKYGDLSLDLEGGNDSLFEVSIRCLSIDLDYKQTERLIRDLNISSQYNCKNNRTYIPNDVFCSMDDSIPNLLNVCFKYVASNSYGVPGDIMTFYTIDISLLKKQYEGFGAENLTSLDFIVDEITTD
jgi:hypothetical protein